MTELLDDVVDAWAELVPVAAYTGGRTAGIERLFHQTPEAAREMTDRLDALRARLIELPPGDRRDTAEAVITSLATQIALSRPSGAGPSGTGAGGVYAVADGCYYIVLKGDQHEEWVDRFLELGRSAIEFETRRWSDMAHTIETRRECLDTVAYLDGAVDALGATSRDDRRSARLDGVKQAGRAFGAIFDVNDLGSAEFDVFWPIFRQWDSRQGPHAAAGYPACLRNYFQLPESADRIDAMASAWMDADLAVTIDLAQRVRRAIGSEGRSTLEAIWSAMSDRYAVTFTSDSLNRIFQTCRAFGQEHILRAGDDDHVNFAETPAFLAALVTSGEDFAIDFLDPVSATSQLYLTAAKNTSVLTMINVLVHEASHGFNFVLSAKSAEHPIYNLNTSLQVPMTEGQAFFREYQFWSAAAELLNRDDLTSTERDYLDLYVAPDRPGTAPLGAEVGVLCAQLETYLWRIVRCVRALCDVRVNGGHQTYVDFIDWAADYTGLSPERLHGECFVFLSEPGYAPCYALGGLEYGLEQQRAALAGVSAIDFNTAVSAMGFASWPCDIRRMSAFGNSAVVT